MKSLCHNLIGPVKQEINILLPALRAELLQYNRKHKEKMRTIQAKQRRTTWRDHAVCCTIWIYLRNAPEKLAHLSSSADGIALEHFAASCDKNRTDPQDLTKPSHPWHV